MISRIIFYISLSTPPLRCRKTLIITQLNIQPDTPHVPRKSCSRVHDPQTMIYRCLLGMPGAKPSVPQKLPHLTKKPNDDRRDHSGFLGNRNKPIVRFPF